LKHVISAGLAGGLIKLVTPKEKFDVRGQWTEDFQPGRVKAIGALEVLAGIGLILPAVVRVVHGLST
jgi:hypothetical protein